MVHCRAALGNVCNRLSRCAGHGRMAREGMTVKVYKQTLTEDELIELLSATRGHLPFAVVERVDDIDFPPAKAVLSPAEWPQGHAFGPTAGVQWKPQDEGFHVLWVGEQPPAAEGWEIALDLTHCAVQTCSYYLWGPDNVALGRTLDYQALPTGSGHPQLTVEEYHNAANGRFVFVRAVAITREGANESL